MFLYGTSPSSIVRFSFRPCIIEGPCCTRSPKQSWIIGTLMSDYIRSISFLLYLLPRLALGQKYSPPSRLLLITLVWCLFLNFFRIHILKPLTPKLFFLPYPQSFMMSLIVCVVNSVKSCTMSGQFSSAGIYCFRPDGFRGFFCNKVIFSGIVLPRFLWSFYWRSLP